MRSVARSLSLLVLLALPAIAHAQTTLAGIVRDPSGGVLPGVTVEASSSVLIEKTRSAVTDGSGQYRITDLPPGVLLDYIHAAWLLESGARGSDAVRLRRHQCRRRAATRES